MVVIRISVRPSGGGAGESNTIVSTGGGTADLTAIPSKIGIILQVKTLSVTADLSLTDAANLLTLGLQNLPALGTPPASPRTTDVNLATEVTGDLPNGNLADLPALGTPPASPRTTDVNLATEVTGDLPNGNLGDLPVLGTLPASPRQVAIVNAEISTVDTSKVTTGRFILARMPTGTDDFFFRGTGAGSPAYQAINISKGGTVLDPDVRDIIVWRAPFACTVTNVRAYRVGGTGATINARKNGSLTHLASDHSITVADVWQDGGAVQNTAYAAGDKLEIEIVTLAGTPTQIAIQVDFTRP